MNTDIIDEAAFNVMTPDEQREYLLHYLPMHFTDKEIMCMIDFVIKFDAASHFEN